MKYIQKEIEDAQTGAIARYHEITLMQVDYAQLTVQATLASYVSKKAKDTGKSSLSYITLQLTNIPTDRNINIHDWVLEKLVSIEKMAEEESYSVGAHDPYLFVDGEVIDVAL